MSINSVVAVRVKAIYVRYVNMELHSSRAGSPQGVVHKLRKAFFISF